MGYKLFATDLDGTLLNTDVDISVENIEAFNRARDKGIYTMICTGRTHMGLMDFEKRLNLVKEGNFSIANNGATIYDTYTRKMIRTKTISYDLVVHILELTRDFCAVRVVYGRDTSYSEAESVFTDDYAHTCGSDKVEISRDLKRSMLGDTLFKILISSDIDTMLNLYKVINTEVGRDCNILFSSKNLLEITSVEATKGQALKFVADRLGIDIKDTIAIGDNYNDIDMIQVAGLGVAIFNAVDDLKSVADYVTKADNNKHAIKEIVDEFIL